MAPSASWASAGGLRTQGRHAADRLLAIRAAARWRELAAELDADLEIVFGGHLHIAEDEREAEVVRRRVVEDADAGVAIELLDAAAIRRVAPGITERALLAAHTPGDGQAHPGRTAVAFARAASRVGAGLCFGVTAAPILGKDGLDGVRLSDGRVIGAAVTVLAAGAWSVALLDGLGQRLPLRWRGLQMLLSEVAAPRLAPTVTAVGRNLSLKQSPSGQFMVGGRWFSAMDEGEVGTNPVDGHIARQWDSAVAIFPGAARLRIAQAWAGVEAQSINSLPFIGRAELKGLYLATGFSNHGFQISPAVGELVADDIFVGEPLLAPFRPDRAAGVAAERIDAFRNEPITV
jgi:sarcosine oxidase subunit beta